MARPTLQVALTGLFTVALAALGAHAANSQTIFQPPRMPDGRPDFQGVWESHLLTPIERLPEASTVVLDAAEAKRVQEAAIERLETGSMNADGFRNEGNTLAVVRGEYRAAMVVDPPDGKLPYRPEAKPRPFVLPTGIVDSYEAIGPNVRCIGGVGGAPLYYAPGANMRTIVQTPSNLMIHSEAINDTRVFGIGAAPRPDALRSAYGDSIAHWDGDTLVVETTHFPARNFRLAPGFTPLIFRGDARMVERFTLIAQDELLYQFTVEDPSTFERPWLAEYSMRRSGQRQFEYACHEGNQAVANILQGSRVQERRAAAVRPDK
jgi:hypothetical protein